MDANIFYIKNFACYAALYLGDFELCEKLFNEMGDIMGMCMVGENDHIMSYYWTWRGHYMYVRGQYHEAAALAGQALKLREKAGGEMYLIKCLLVLGGALREAGNLQDSEYYLQEALSRSIAAGSIFLEASCHLQLAILYDLLDNKELFTENLDGLFRISMEKSYYHFFSGGMIMRLGSSLKPRTATNIRFMSRNYAGAALVLLTLILKLTIPVPNH